MKKYDPIFLKFADNISKRYLVLKDGDVFIQESAGREYKIEIHEFLTGGQVSTPARVGRESGTIELQLSVLRHYNYRVDFVYWLLLWCEASLQQEAGRSDIFKADRRAMLQYLSEHRNKKYLAIGMAQTFLNADTPENRKRYQLVWNFIIGGAQKIKTLKDQLILALKLRMDIKKAEKILKNIK